MPEVAELSYSLGKPVEIGRIERELKALWEEGDGAMTRASSMNLAVYSEAADSLPANTQIIAEVTQDHACRAIVLGADVAATKPGVEAWINAHCHVAKTGAKQICSEQISVLLSGASAKLLPSILFAQLDSDLPLYLWWQGEMPAATNSQLWRWIDRLIYDSHSWNDFRAQLARIEAAKNATSDRMVLCDLNWTRIVHLRSAFAQFFDHPSSHHHFKEINEISIDAAAGFRSTALLFVGWLAAQLNWTYSSGTDGALTFTNEAGGVVRVTLNTCDGASISGVRAVSRGVEFVVSRADCGDLLQVGRGRPGDVQPHQLLPAIGDDPVRLLSEELQRGGPHRLYLRALERIRPLL